MFCGEIPPRKAFHNSSVSAMSRLCRNSCSSTPCPLQLGSQAARSASGLIGKRQAVGEDRILIPPDDSSWPAPGAVGRLTGLGFGGTLAVRPNAADPLNTVTSSCNAWRR